MESGMKSVAKGGIIATCILNTLQLAKSMNMW